jgi:hypothetical protein
VPRGVIAAYGSELRDPWLHTRPVLEGKVAGAEDHCWSAAAHAVKVQAITAYVH